MLISFSLCHLQRFKGTEPIEEVTEQVKAVKIEEKPKEVKEVVDEVQLQDVDFCRCCYCWQFIFHLWPCTLTNFRCSCFSQGPPKYTKSVLKKGDKVNFPKKGETVSCWYTGSLEDGTVFDTNIPAGMTNEQFNSWECRASLFTTWNHSVFVVNANSNRLEWSSGLNLPSFLSAAARKKRQTKPLSFKAGLGRVIRGVSNDVFFLFCASKLVSVSQYVIIWSFVSHSGMRPSWRWARVKRLDWRLNQSGPMEGRVSLKTSILFFGWVGACRVNMCLCSVEFSRRTFQLVSSVWLKLIWSSVLIMRLQSFASTAVPSLTPTLPEFHPTQSWFSRSSLWLWINCRTLASMRFI